MSDSIRFLTGELVDDSYSTVVPLEDDNFSRDTVLSIVSWYIV
jgi:hypothetical protein